MLRGRFGDTSKRPYLEGRLLIPRLRVWSDISFLVDTGADKTTLLPADSLKMGLDYNTLTKSSDPAIGIGGISHKLYRTVYRSYSTNRAKLFMLMRLSWRLWNQTTSSWASRLSWGAMFSIAGR